MNKLLENPRAICLMLAMIIIPLSLWDQNLWGQSPAGETAASTETDSNADADKPSVDASTEGDSGETDGEEATSEGDSEAAPTDESEDAEVNEKTIWNSGAIGLLLEGGLFMWPIALMGILATGVIIERFRSLRMVNTNAEQVRDQVLTLLHEDRVEEAL